MQHARGLKNFHRVIHHTGMCSTGVTVDEPYREAMTQKDDRFEIIHEDKKTGEFTRILRDTVTGVCYLHTWVTNGGGLTVLVNQDGSPVVLAP